MGFIDSYKRLEKLLNEIYGDNHGISTYIDEMVICDGSYCVSDWKKDLKQLKHYRWVRNQIVHEPNCTEENMCTYEDIQWINNFYLRVMDANDPIAKYRRLKNKTKLYDKKTEDFYAEHKYENTSGKSVGWLTFLAGVLLGSVITFLVFNIMKF